MRKHCRYCGGGAVDLWEHEQACVSRPTAPQKCAHDDEPCDCGCVLACYRMVTGMAKRSPQNGGGK